MQWTGNHAAYFNSAHVGMYLYIEMYMYIRSDTESDTETRCRDGSVQAKLIIQSLHK